MTGSNLQFSKIFLTNLWRQECDVVGGTNIEVGEQTGRLLQLSKMRANVL